MALPVRDVADAERGKLQRIARAKPAPVRPVGRARIVLLAVEDWNRQPTPFLRGRPAKPGGNSSARMSTGFEERRIRGP
jgi:hypothetical protein